MSAAASLADDRGFTLIELLAALAILALAWLLVAPALPEGLLRSELEASAASLAAELRDARARAMAEGREIAVDVRREGVAVASAEPGFVRFFPEGGATAASLSLQAGERSARIEVDWLTGRVSLAQ